MIGSGIEGDAPADPALEHIVLNLDLGHGLIGAGADPWAVLRKGWPATDALVAFQGQSAPVEASLQSPCASAAAWGRPAAS